MSFNFLVPYLDLSNGLSGLAMVMLVLLWSVQFSYGPGTMVNYPISLIQLKDWHEPFEPWFKKHKWKNYLYL